MRKNGVSNRKPNVKLPKPTYRGFEIINEVARSNKGKFSGFSSLRAVEDAFEDHGLRRPSAQRMLRTAGDKGLVEWNKIPGNQQYYKLVRPLRETDCS